MRIREFLRPCNSQLIHFKGRGKETHKRDLDLWAWREREDTDLHVRGKRTREGKVGMLFGVLETRDAPPSIPKLFALD